MGRLLLSNYQYTLLESCQDGVPLVDVGRFKQATFASLVRAGYLQFNRRRARFITTREGRDALAAFHSADVERKHPNDILAQYVRTYLGLE